MDRIGKYVIERVLGEGATSLVYLARDPFTNRDVAVKVVKPEVLKDPEQGHIFKRLFVIEASLAGKLTHPHIAAILDAVNDGENPYLVVEYVPGGTLEPYCAYDHLLSPERAVEVIFKCSRALEFAHRIGVTHRDIKPANILIEDSSGAIRDIKITDFGAALTGAQDITAVSGIGSPAYMSPQQVKDHPLDHRTDIYSLGVVLFQLLTGRLPFEASNNFSMIYQIVNDEIPAPTSFRPGLPKRLDEIVARATHKDIDLRYQEWAEFSFDLADLYRDRDAMRMTNSEIADSEKFTTLRELSFFRDFSDVELWEVVRLSEWGKHTANTTLIHENETGDFFYILASGQAKVIKRGKLLNVIETGECIGDMAYLTNALRGVASPRSADVVTMNQTTTIKLTNAVLSTASQACRYRFDRAFLNILVDRLTLANNRLAQ
jgi:serine/threonine protein kinase